MIDLVSRISSLIRRLLRIARAEITNNYQLTIFARLIDCIKYLSTKHFKQFFLEDLTGTKKEAIYLRHIYLLTGKNN